MGGDPSFWRGDQLEAAAERLRAGTCRASHCHEGQRVVAPAEQSNGGFRLGTGGVHRRNADCFRQSRGVGAAGMASVWCFCLWLRHLAKQFGMIPNALLLRRSGGQHRENVFLSHVKKTYTILQIYGMLANREA